LAIQTAKVAGFAFLYCVLTATVSRSSLSAQSGASIEGTVLELDSSNPLQNARVQIHPGTAVATTDAEGHFKLDGLLPGRYRIEPIFEYFTYSREDRVDLFRDSGVWVQVESNAQIKNLSLTMVRSGVITGRIVRDDGKNAVNVITYLKQLRFDDYGRKKLISVLGPTAPGQTSILTDDRGIYRLFDIPPGDYYLGFRGTGVWGFFPGTDDERFATPIHVRPGEEVQAPVMNGKPPVPVRSLNFSYIYPPELAFAPDDISFVTPYLGDTMTMVGAIQAGNQIHIPAGATRIIATAGRSGLNIPLYYNDIQIPDGTADVTLALTFLRGAKITGSLELRRQDGTTTNVPGLNCILRSDSLSVSGAKSPTCIGQQYSRGIYNFELQNIPADDYVVSATASGKDILSQPLQLEGDTEIRVILATNGGIIKGKVSDALRNIPDAVIALVPDAPLQQAGPLYRSVTSDLNGTFELHGIRPGTYRLFAWSSLDGAGYRNAEFMKVYQERGTPVRIEKDEQVSIDLQVLN
jgi:hypothetical protein